MKQIIIRHSDYSFFCFDFDGVILDTIDLKAEGFAHAFDKLSDNQLLEILEYQKKNGGQDRINKFIHLSQLIGREEPSSEKLEALSTRLTEYVLGGIERAPYIEGFLEFLEKAQDLEMPCAIASAMPQLELHEILNFLGIKSHFKVAYGMPVPKVENLATIKDALTTAQKPGLYFGDTLSDFEAAQKSGLDFLGIGKNEAFDPMLIKSAINFLDVALN